MKISRGSGRGVSRAGLGGGAVLLLSLAATGCFRRSDPDPDVSGTERTLSPLTGVLTQHNDLARTGANLNETILTTSNVHTGTFGKVHSYPVTGQVYAQPLYVAQAFGGKNVVYIATEANNVYAFNADSPWELLWSRTTIETPWMSASTCVNTQPLIGISSTPVIDPSTSTIYLSAKRNVNGVFKYMLHALNMTTGADKTGSPIDMGLNASGQPLSVVGTGDGMSGGRITFDPIKHQNRVALTLSQGVLTVGFAAHCDQNNYHGWVLRFDTTTTPIRPLTPYMTNPNTGHGGLWMGGAGFNVDANGDLYMVSGDGKAGTTNTTGTQLANAFIKLTNVGIAGTPTVASWFMPSDVAALDNADADIGSSGALLIPGTSRIIGGGKNGIFYVLETAGDAMGHFMAGTPPDPQIVQRFSPSSNNGQIVGGPAWWESPAGPRLYVWPGNATMGAFAFNRGTGLFTITATSRGTVTANGGDPQGGQLSLSANGSTAGTGIVWATRALGSTGGGGFNSSTPVGGVLYAFNAENLATKLWDSSLVAADKLANAPKYIPPTIANGKVYVGTLGAAPTTGGEVAVYGLLNPSDGGVGGSPGTGGAGGSMGTGGTSPPPPLSCATVDGGAPQPTNWTYVYNTYFAGTTTSSTAGHCSECHTSTLAGFACGLDKDTCYTGLVSSGKVTPASPTASPLADPNQSPLAWFGNPSPPPGVLAFMPTDLVVRNAPAVAAVCGWVQAGARDDKSNGQTCASGNDCATGFCVDGVCCSAACGGTCQACTSAKTGQPNGTCASTSAGQTDARCTAVPPCGFDGTCNGGGACRQTPSGTGCGVTASCTGGVAQSAATCNGTGTCLTPSPQACAPYLCGATSCATTCTTGANCAPGAQCTGGLCVACTDGICCPAGQTACGGVCVSLAVSPNCGGCGIICGSNQTCSGMQCKALQGQICSTASQCASGSCVDGVCCDTACGGTCTACSGALTGAADGTCAPRTVGVADTRCGAAPPCGNTGTCAANATCQVAPATTSCRAASCTGGTATAAATCNGNGACPSPVATSCNPYVCGPTACKTTCAADADCIAGDFCSGTTCVPKQVTGSTCSAANQCATGVCSADGICCSGACSLSCQACSNAQTGLATGTCGPKLTPAGTNVCSNMCVNTLTDVANCGGCGQACAVGATCSNGTCSVAACSTTNALIDNFDDGNNQLSLLEARNGTMYTFRDSAGTTITPAQGTTFVPAAGGNGGSAKAAHFTGHLANSTPVWAGFGFDYLAPKALYNASKYTGITFFAKKGSSTASSAMRLKVPDRNTDPAGGVCTSCNNDFGADITLTTTWTQFTVRFTNMTQQAGWGAPRPAKIDATGLLGVKFQLETKNVNYDVWIDDVKFICN